MLGIITSFIAACVLVGSLLLPLFCHADELVVGDRLMLTSMQCPVGEIAGTATVTDGDTIRLNGMAIRLQGVAAPELDEGGGYAAAAYLRRLVNDELVRCQLNGEASYQRCVGICSTDGVDNIALVDLGYLSIVNGVARACPRYSPDHYLEAEKYAKADGATISRWYPLPSYCKE